MDKETKKLYLILGIIVVVLVVWIKISPPGPNYNYPPKPKPEPSIMELHDASIVMESPVCFGEDPLSAPFGINVVVLGNDGKTTVNFYVPDPESYLGYSHGEKELYQITAFRALLSYPNLVRPGKMKIDYLKLQRVNDSKLPGVEWRVYEVYGFYQSK